MSDQLKAFQLKRHFSLVSLIGIAAVVAALSWFYRTTAENALIDHQTESNAALARLVANAVWARHGSFIQNAHEIDPQQLAERPEIQQLDADIRHHLAQLNVLKVKIFGPNGRTVYSTEPAQIGRDGSTSLGVQRALGGEIASELSFRDQYYALEGYVVDRDLVTSYVPIRMQLDEPVQAVVELYSDVTALAARNTATQ